MRIYRSVKGSDMLLCGKRVDRESEVNARDMTKVGPNAIENLDPCQPTSASSDGELMDLLRLYWKVGDWRETVRTMPSSINEHPDRAVLALLLGAAYLQVGNEHDGSSWIQKARDWGAGPVQIARVLVSGAYNSIGRAWAIQGNQKRALDNIEHSIGVGAQPATANHFSNERRRSQAVQLISELGSNGVIPSGLEKFVEDIYSMGRGGPEWRPAGGKSNEYGGSEHLFQGHAEDRLPVPEGIGYGQFFINSQDAWKLQNKIPATDLIASAYDLEQRQSPDHLLVILSTPRSGSTLLCDLFHQSGLCTPHEYFQPHQYMPILAARWQCGSHHGKVPLASYVKALLAQRTSHHGWLGINVHESHLHIFEKACVSFPNVPCRYVLLTRRDTVAQAVSYEIARQTGKWSSDFSERTVPQYDFQGVRKAVNQIEEQNRLLERFCERQQFDPYRLTYEDLIEHSEAVTSRLTTWLDAPIPLTPRSSIFQQGSHENERWKLQYLRDLRSEHNPDEIGKLTSGLK